MIKPHRLLIVIIFAVFLPFCCIAEAPVVSDSENYALLDDRQAAYEEPAEQRSLAYSDEEQPLATEATETRSDNGNSALLLDKIHGLQQEIQELRGQLEVQTHQLKQLEQQQLAFYKDLDARLGNEGNKVVKNEPATTLNLDERNKPTPAPAVVAHGNPADEQIGYLAAYELVKNKRYDEALVAMQKFVAQHPQGGYTANAHYWLGELYLIKKNHPDAIMHFEIVLKQFPSSNKTAASSLKLGYALAASGKRQEAIQRLQLVVKNYPDTTTAKLASAKLESLNS